MADLQSYADKYPEWKDKVVPITASINEDRETVVKYLNAKRLVQDAQLYGWH